MYVLVSFGQRSAENATIFYGLLEIMGYMIEASNGREEITSPYLYGIMI
jgi:hypothetical protein